MAGILDLLGLSANPIPDIVLDNVEGRPVVYKPSDSGELNPIFVFVSDESLSGVVIVPSSKRMEHSGVKIQFIGDIELVYDRGNRHEFVKQVDMLSQPGVISDDGRYPFNFETPEKLYESYSGINVRLRYYLKFTIIRKFRTDIIKELEIWVINYNPLPDMNPSLKMEVGIEDCLHIEFEYERSKCHLKDVIIGKIFFLVVRIEIKYMEIGLIRRETAGTGPNVYHENETITKFEIMDGTPVRGESIPVRLFLGGFDLTPTYQTVQDKFSVNYWLNLVLVDNDDRRYYKETEIFFWRKQPGDAENNHLRKMKKRRRRRKKVEKNE